MSAETKWTPEPWRVVDSSWQYSIIVGENRDHVAELSIEDNEETADAEGKVRDANAQRVVACVNSLANLDPAGITDAVAALEAFEAGADKLNPIHFDSGTQYGQFMRDMRQTVRAALAKLRPQSPPEA